MIEIHKVDTTDRQDVKRFVQFPFHLYRDCPQWVPPLVSSARKQLDRERHPFYQHSDADFFLAMQRGDVVGRIAVLEPRKRNTYRGKQGAFFYLFETVEDIKVARALFAAAFDWARGRGLKEISGPDGLLPGDGLGVLVKGFEQRPAMGITYNYPYYDAFIKDSGFQKQTDYNSWHLPGDFELPERISRIAGKMQERRGFGVLHFQCCILREPGVYPDYWRRRQKDHAAAHRPDSAGPGQGCHKGRRDHWLCAGLSGCFGSAATLQGAALAVRLGAAYAGGQAHPLDQL
jgi:GNAT superfamily N-acetyltransferase